LIYSVLVNFGDDIRLTFPKSETLEKLVEKLSSSVSFNSGDDVRLTFPKSETLEKLVKKLTASVSVNSGARLSFNFSKVQKTLEKLLGNKKTIRN